MFEITGDDIALLSDEDLRALVARLCEAELRNRDLSACHVTWGGNQTASDGGIDVWVALPLDSKIDDFIPRAVTGYQVKKQDMPRNEIRTEMQPNGTIRPSIQQLADDSGAYVIVSSKGSLTHSALQDRLHAMRDAVSGIRNADKLELDFYDRSRIATWVRTHECLIPWVREAIGKPIQGWHSYGSWSDSSDKPGTHYLLDKNLRIYSSRKGTGEGISALEGIQQLRDRLREERSFVRLLGLSGVGKTRLVEALFDETIGENSLIGSDALYTNMGDEPDPPPIHLASHLIAAKTRAILIIDNCPPDLHKRLTELCRTPSSRLSVITVEYDIREDEPEGTDVFTLQPASIDLTEQLVRRRFLNLSEIDIRTVSGLSGGNARIAIALASTVERTGTISGLTDEQVFQRLFFQRHAADNSLYLAAQVCSLVYSFQGEDISEAKSAELWRLGKLIGKTPNELYRNVAELKRRDLVQQRNTWRAVLPQALANRFAATALENVHYTTLEQHLAVDGAERLLKSFSRRLGYLNGSREARNIVQKWLAADGLLKNIADLNELGLAMLENVAPVAPEEILAGLERALPQLEAMNLRPNRRTYLDLLRSLSYEADMFNRSVDLIAQLAVQEGVKERCHATEIFVSLFHLALSGTHASIEQRLAVIESLLKSSDDRRRALGVLGLKASLKSRNFQSFYSFEFGGHSRDYGYWPRTKLEVQHWFRLTLKLVEEIACSDAAAAAPVRAALAENLRELWRNSGIPEELEIVCQAVSADRFWPEGWIAIRQILDFDARTFQPEERARAVRIEASLRPRNLIEQVQSVVLSLNRFGVALDDFEDGTDADIQTRIRRTEELSRSLGTAVATDECLDALIPEIMSTDGRLWSFGQGLSDGAADLRSLWDRLTAGLSAIERTRQKPQVLGGFLNALNRRSPAIAGSLLDDAVKDPTLARWYPFLQVSVSTDQAGVARLKRSLSLGKAPPVVYTNLVRAPDPIPPTDMKDLLLSIAAMPSGSDVAIDILHMRLHSDREQDIAPELVEVGCELIRQFTFAGRDNRGDYEIGTICQSCLKGDQGPELARKICGQLKDAVSRHETHAIYHDDLLQGCFGAQPEASLDALCGGDARDLERGIRILEDFQAHKHPLVAVPDENLLSWCDQDPATRYPAIAQIISISHYSKDLRQTQWTPIALSFLERAPDPAEILRRFVWQFSPTEGWRGTLSATLESNAILLDQLEGYPNLKLAVEQEKMRLHKRIEDQKSEEAADARETDERFE